MENLNNEIDKLFDEEIRCLTVENIDSDEIIEIKTAIKKLVIKYAESI